MVTQKDTELTEGHSSYTAITQWDTQSHSSTVTHFIISHPNKAVSNILHVYPVW